MTSFMSINLVVENSPLKYISAESEFEFQLLH